MVWMKPWRHRVGFRRDVMAQDHFGGAGQVERQPAVMRDAAARPERRTQAGLQLMNAMVPCSNSCAMMQSLEKPSPSR